MDKNMFLVKLKSLSKELHCKISACATKMYEPYDLTYPQVEVLIEVYRQGRKKVSELGTNLNTADSNISSICRRLEKRELLVRERDEIDQRVVYIKLTNKGVDIIKQFENKRKEFLTNMSQVSEEDMNMILKAFEKVNDILDETFVKYKESDKKIEK